MMWVTPSAAARTKPRSSSDNERIWILPDGAFSDPWCSKFLAKHQPVAVNRANAKLSHAPRFVGQRLGELCPRLLILAERASISSTVMYP